MGPNRGHGLLSPPATQVSLGSSPSPLPLSSSSAGEDSRFLPWLKAAARPPQAPPLSESDNYVIQAFFSKYTLLPYHFGSHHTVDSNERDGYQRASQGFLEFLPCTFEEVNVRGRLALRWAVQAAASADAASHASRHGISDETNAASSKGARLNLQQRALECYGKALSALSDSLGKVGKVPDDYDLMTVVVLDVFEVSLPKGPKGLVHHFACLNADVASTVPFPSRRSLSRLSCAGNVSDPQTPRA